MSCQCKLNGACANCCEAEEPSQIEALEAKIDAIPNELRYKLNKNYLHIEAVKQVIEDYFNSLPVEEAK